MGNIDLEHVEDMTVTLTLEDDSELECSVIAVFPVNDLQYIALLPLESDEENGEIYLYRLESLTSEDAELINIEDDEEFDAVADAFDDLMEEQEYEDLLDE